MVVLQEAYNVLGVRPWASEAEVREAHHGLIRVWHPDRHQGDPRLAQKADEKIWLAKSALESIQYAGFPSTQPGHVDHSTPGWQSQPQAAAEWSQYQQPPAQSYPPPSWQAQQPLPQYQTQPHQAQWTPPQARSQGGGGALLVGVIAIIVGVGITAGTHEAAVESGGGHYFVAYGPIAFGVICILRGLKAMVA